MKGRVNLIFKDGTEVTDKKYAKGNFTYAEIVVQGKLYMRRWYLLVFPKLFSIRVHHIMMADLDQWPHDHPWSFVSFILRGGYIEWHCTPDTFATVPAKEPKPGYWTKRVWGKFKIKRVRRFNYHNNTDLHQIRVFERGSDKGSWTLIFTGPERREWGFMTEDGWVDRKTLNLGASTEPY